MKALMAVALASPALGSGVMAAGDATSNPVYLVGGLVIGAVITPTSVAWMFIRGVLHSDKEFQRIVDDSERRRVDNESLRAAFTDTFTPLVTRSTSVLEDVVALLRHETRLPRRPTRPGDD